MAFSWYRKTWGEHLERNASYFHDKPLSLGNSEAQIQHSTVNQVGEAVMKSGTPKPELCPHWGSTCPPALLSSPLWADMRGAGADREQAEPSVVIPDGNKLDSFLSHPAVAEPHGSAQGTVALPLLSGQAGDLFPSAMCEAPIGAHKPLKLHVLWGMTNKGLQSFEKAEIFDDYPNQIPESFEDGLLPLKGSVLRGTGRSCNCLTSF